MTDAEYTLLERLWNEQFQTIQDLEDQLHRERQLLRSYDDRMKEIEVGQLKWEV